MTTNVSEALIGGFAKVLRQTGFPVRLKYFYQTTGSVYNDDLVLVQSGADLWISGVVLPLKLTSFNLPSTDMTLLKQGLLNPSDKRLFVEGGTNIMPDTGSLIQIKIGLGSPVGATDEYAVLSQGATNYEVSNVSIYKSVYIRRLTNGSLIGE